MFRSRPGLLALAAVIASAVAVPARAAICTANIGNTPVSCVIRRPPRGHVVIKRDDYGVPHLKARTLYDVGYGIGLGQAQDRLFQMDL